MGEPATSRRTVLTADELGRAFERFAPAVLQYCLRHGSADEAEDLVSVVFLEAWRSRDQAVVADDSLAPWLFGIAKNVLRTKRRSLRRHRAALQRYEATCAPEHAEDPADRVHALADTAALGQVIDAALERLSEKDRVVVVRCLVGEQTTAQAAEQLGIPEGTVKSRLSHARVALRRLLRPGDEAREIEPELTGGHVEVGRGTRVPEAKVSRA